MSNDKARAFDNRRGDRRICTGCGAVSTMSAIGDRCTRTAGELACAGTFQAEGLSFISTPAQTAAEWVKVDGAWHITSDAIVRIKAAALLEAADDFYGDTHRLSTAGWLRERATRLLNGFA